MHMDNAYSSPPIIPQFNQYAAKAIIWSNGLAWLSLPTVGIAYGTSALLAMFSTAVAGYVGMKLIDVSIKQLTNRSTHQQNLGRKPMDDTAIDNALFSRNIQLARRFFKVSPKPLRVKPSVLLGASLCKVPHDVLDPKHIIVSSPLLDHLNHDEVIAVVAHEYMHEREKAYEHTLAVKDGIRPWFPLALAYSGVIFSGGSPLIAGALAAGAVAFPSALSALYNRHVRKVEFGCDRGSALALKSGLPLCRALKKMEKKNKEILGKLPGLRFVTMIKAPLPFYDSHPTLRQRRLALHAVHREMRQSGLRQNTVPRI